VAGREGYMNERLQKMIFAEIYKMYTAKVERKGRTAEEVDIVLCWLFGYNNKELKNQIETKATLEQFFASAPKINPNAVLIKGVVCGCRVEDIADPFMQKVRYMDKLVDEIAKGKKIEQILRTA
jgi:hypothetical protein